MSINWKWGAEEKKKGDEGFNNAGILTFNSHAINSFVRELFQNSNDAKPDDENKIKIKIEYKHISKNEIPEFDNYMSILNAVKLAHPNQTKFFIKASEVLKNESIPFLVYSDYRTKGLIGKEDDSYSSFVACVLSEGISAKENKTAGGSYGIGKNAIYGVSSLRTVFYSSMDLEENVIFQGVAKLASYKKNGKNHEGRIYLGNGDDRLSIREAKDIPKVFKRQGSGLTQFVMGVELDSSWYNDFAKAILRNYWMLLLEDKLEIELIHNGTLLIEINSRNSASLIESLFKNDIEEYNLTPYGNPYLFLDAFVNGIKVELDIPLIGKCSFHYKESDVGENNIAYIRNGMVIISKIEKRLVGASITGVFKCDTDFGNEILRKMEPPKHDSFEPQMLEDNHENLNRKDGEKILSQIKSKIREVIKSLIEKYKQETETPVFLTELFEDLHKSIVSGTKGERKNEKSISETIYRKAVEDEISVSLFSEAENDYISNFKGEISGQGGGIDQGEGPKGKNKPRKKGGKSKSGGGVKDGKTPKLPIKSRVFHFDERDGKNIYKSIVHSESDLGNIELAIAQYADSGEDIAFQLHDVRDNEGNPISFTEIKDADGLVSEYKVKLDTKKGKNIFFLEISDNQKSAFVING
jgi:hypothetical protein